MTLPDHHHRGHDQPREQRRVDYENAYVTRILPNVLNAVADCNVITTAKDILAAFESTA